MLQVQNELPLQMTMNYFEVNRLTGKFTPKGNNVVLRDPPATLEPRKRTGSQQQREKKHGFLCFGRK